MRNLGVNTEKGLQSSLRMGRRYISKPAALMDGKVRGFADIVRKLSDNRASLLNIMNPRETCEMYK